MYWRTRATRLLLRCAVLAFHRPAITGQHVLAARTQPDWKNRVTSGEVLDKGRTSG